MEVGHGRDREWLAIAASACQQVAVELGDRGWADGLDQQVADARRDVEPDAGVEVEQGPRLDLHRVAVDPVIEVGGDGDAVASMYSPRRAFTLPSSRAALASSSVAKPLTHLGLLMPVSG